MTRLSFDSLPTCSVSCQSSPNWFFSNLLKQGQLAVVDAAPGAGLSWLLMELAGAAASRRQFAERFDTDIAVKSVYVNAGMEQEEVTSRFAKLIDTPDLNRVKILVTNEILKSQKVFFDLSEPDYRDILLDGFEADNEYRLLVIDSLESLFPKYKANAESINKWFLSLKQKGITIVVGSNGGMKLHNELIDLNLKLSGVAQGGSLLLKVDFKKSRSLSAATCRTFFAELKEGEDGSLKLAYVDRKDAIVERVAFLISEGLTQNQTASELGIGQSTVSRRLNKALQTGLLELKNRYYVLTEKGKTQIKGKVEDLLVDE